MDRAGQDSAERPADALPTQGSFGTATAVSEPSPSKRIEPEDVVYRQYSGEADLAYVMGLVDNELSEPYSIFTYRYFLHTWPTLCFLAFHEQHCFGTVVCKLDKHGEMMRGYIAMLVVERTYRGLGVGSKLVRMAIEAMIAAGDTDEVVLEAEVTNQGALSLYTNLGFIRDKRLARYYMNGVDAFRLKLMLPMSPEKEKELAAAHLKNLSMHQEHRHQHSHCCNHHHHHVHDHSNHTNHDHHAHEHAHLGGCCGHDHGAGHRRSHGTRK